MSILGNVHLGQVEGDSFVGIEKVSNHDYVHFYCCDRFDVEAEITDDNLLIFKVTFYTPTGEQSFEWTLQSLSYLSKPYVLSDILLKHGVRCSTAQKATVAILSTIQNTYIKKETLQ